MCGILGYVKHGACEDPEGAAKIVISLLKISESRGREAAGLAVFNGGCAVFKRPVSASALVGRKDFRQFLHGKLAQSADGFIAIGHTRLATNGAPGNPDNIQPVVSGPFVTVHNGIVVNDRELRKKYPGLAKDGDSDTVLLNALFRRFQTEGGGDLPNRVYAEISGMASTLTVDCGSGTLYAGTNNGSLYCCRSADGRHILFASEKQVLAKLMRIERRAAAIFAGCEIRQVPSREGLMYSHSTGELRHFRMVEKGSCPAPAAVQDRPVQIDIGESTQILHPPVIGHDWREFDIDVEPIRKLRRCTRCVLPETMPFIEFDDEGVCNYCRTYQRRSYAGEAKVREMADRLRRRDGQYDSLVSFSGGRDSCYGLHYFVRELGLRPLAYSYDWGMVTDIARRNQSRMCAALGIELITVSADLSQKRRNIKKNILAWLQHPDLGMIPLFMAGDKHYFYYANKICQENHLSTILMTANPFEETHFKSGFCGVCPKVLRTGEANSSFERLPVMSVLKMSGYYGGQFLRSLRYFNSSLWDTFTAALSYYVVPHNYFRLFNYIPWNEEVVDSVLESEYGWERSPDCHTTWRIGDGTAPFYNYIYYRLAGFTENDTLRSNQIREGMIDRAKALEYVYLDNVPRYESMKWYFDVVGLDMADTLKKIAAIRPIYEK